MFLALVRWNRRILHGCKPRGMRVFDGAQQSPQVFVVVLVEFGEIRLGSGVHFLVTAAFSAPQTPGGLGTKEAFLGVKSEDHEV